MNCNEILEIYEQNKELYSLTIELVNQCNLRCKHCYLDNKNLSLSKQKVFQILDELRCMGTYEIKLSGGEIMLREDLSEIIEYARKNFFSVVLLTNLTMLDETIIKTIVHYGVNRIEITLFSLSEEVNDDFVGAKGALKKTLKNIKILRALGVEILVKTWAIKSNYNELEKMNEYFKKEGCKFNVHTQIYDDIYGVHKLPEELRLNEEEFSRALAFSDKSLNRAFPLFNKDCDILCREFLSSMYICSDGNIIPCAKARKLVIGNVNDDRISNIWEESEKLKVIQNYRWGNVDGCKNCKTRNYCVRCGAMAVIKEKSFLENCDETCKLAKLRALNYVNREE